MDYITAVYTDIGTRKSTNQDSLCLRRVSLPEGGEMLFAAVCDGMGGLEKGELASAAVIRGLETWFDANVGLLAAAQGFGAARQQLTDLIAQLNLRIAAYAAQGGAQMGSTLTALLAVNSRCLLVNVGDSRIYRVKNGVTQLTQDQSLVEREIQQGRITREEARHHPQKNVLLQCIGIGREVIPAFTECRVEPDSVYLLCSDGFCHELAEEELAGALNPAAMGTQSVMQDAAFRLAELCKSRGETDNITVVLCKTKESALAAVPSRGIFQRLFRKKVQAQPELPPVVLESEHLLHTEEQI